LIGRLSYLSIALSKIKKRLQRAFSPRTQLVIPACTLQQSVVTWVSQQSDFLDIFFFLISKGADLQYFIFNIVVAENKMGKTPLDLARENNNDHIIKFMKENFESIINAAV